MSDAVLRAMERPGAVASFADRVHRLNARLRAGRVSRDRVDLAAWCGSESGRSRCMDCREARMRAFAIGLAMFVAFLVGLAMAVGR